MCACRRWCRWWTTSSRARRSEWGLAGSRPCKGLPSCASPITSLRAATAISELRAPGEQTVLAIPWCLSWWWSDACEGAVGAGFSNETHLCRSHMPHEPIAEACHCCFLIRYLVRVQLAHHLPSSQEMGWQRPEFTLEVTRQLRVH